MLGVFMFDTALLYSLSYHISTIIYDNYSKLILNASLHLLPITYGSSSASSNCPASMSIASSISVPL